MHFLTPCSILILLAIPRGIQWVAALKSDMDIMCQVRVGASDAWHAWRRYLYCKSHGINLTFSIILTFIFHPALAMLAAGIVYTRQKVASRSAESRRVASLVQIALDTLRRQELSHHSDPVTYPYPFLSSMHLRDDILEDEHSTAVRRRVWDKVERVVEGNSNVRANVEVVNGDETRVWRWVGGGGSLLSGASPQKRVQFTDEGNGGLEE